MLKIALLSMIVIQVYSQTAHDKWKYCQILFENKNSKTSFETCDACFIPLAYYNSIGASLTRSRYRPVSLPNHAPPVVECFETKGLTAF